MNSKFYIIYGASSSLDWFVNNSKETPELIKNCLVIVDDNIKQEIKEIYGVKCMSSQKFLQTRGNKQMLFPNDIVGVISLFNIEKNRKAIQKMKNFFNSIGINSIKMLCQFEQFYEAMDKDNVIDFKSKQITQAYNLLNDPISKSIFMDLLITYGTKKFFSIISQKYQNSYFPPDIQFKKGYKVFLDCGSYDGDTLTQLNKRNLDSEIIEQAYAFQPDPNNFEKMLKVSKTVNFKVKPFNCGVYDEQTTLRFHSQGIGSSISENGTVQIKTVKIDDICLNSQVTFIKMDIQGVQMKALKGAEQTIIKHTPDLAISIYHNITDLWQIINYINSINNKYKYYIRNHSGTYVDTVLYATQK